VLIRDDLLPEAIQAKALNAAGYLAALADNTSACTFFEASLAHYRALDDKSGMAFALLGLGEVALNDHEWMRSAALLRESEAHYRAMGDKRGVAWALSIQSWLSQSQDDIAQTITLLKESLALYREVQGTGGIAVTLINLGNMAFEQGNNDQATAFQLEA
jgi:tetratricopeptide (TPR) repeat protein